MLVVSLLLFPIFGMWAHAQEKRGRPALIPNSVWRNASFVSIGTLSFLSWATITANQYFLALSFENFQLLSAFGASLRFLPIVVSGVLAEVSTGFLVRRIRADHLIAGAAVLYAVAPMLIALAGI
jgi:hypothetical protein